MVKIGSGLIKQRLQTPSKSSFISGGDLQIQTSPTFGEPYCSHKIKTLKAVYPHFSQAKRELKKGQSTSLNQEELELAMEEAKSDYEAMRTIQERLNHAYAELMSLKSEI